jgi:hypothetical protein
MRGADERSGSLFSYIDLEWRVPGEHLSATRRQSAELGLAVRRARRHPRSPWRLVGAGAPTWQEQESAGKDLSRSAIGCLKGAARAL